MIPNRYERPHFKHTNIALLISPVALSSNRNSLLPQLGHFGWLLRCHNQSKSIRIDGIRIVRAISIAGIMLCPLHFILLYAVSIRSAFISVRNSLAIKRCSRDPLSLFSLVRQLDAATTAPNWSAWCGCSMRQARRAPLANTCRPWPAD